MSEVCGANADDRYCPAFWNLTEEMRQLREECDDEIERLRDLIIELLENTGLDVDERAEWLTRAGIGVDEEEVPPDGVR